MQNFSSGVWNVSSPRRIGYEFQDESQDATRRFTSVASLTTTTNGLLRLNSDLETVIGGDGGNEVKWSRITNRAKSDRARVVVGIVVNLAEVNELRVDVLTWDREDARHRGVSNPDRLKEHVNMRSTLSAWVQSNRWGPEMDWHPRPDQLEGVDWDHMDNATGFKRRKYRERLPDTHMLNHSEVAHNLNARTVPIDSKASLPTQVCDLFAGAAAFSHGGKHGESSNWSKVELHQMSIPSPSKTFYEGLTGTKGTGISPGEGLKIDVITAVMATCERREFRVRGQDGLETPYWASSQPVNFWLYNPKRKDDRAPSKSR